jgi:alpha-L-rhamnosidase
VVGGINPDDTRPGFQNVIIKPEVGGGITNVFASFNSIHGPIVCSWTNGVGGSNIFSIALTIPANTTASVYLPSTNNVAGISESGGPATNAAGVITWYVTNPPGYTRGATVFQIGSGTYKFSLGN